MKCITIIITLLAISIFNGEAQNDVFKVADDYILTNSTNPYLDLSNLDSTLQMSIIEYVCKYNSDTTINEMQRARSFIYNNYYKSRYLTVKQKAVNYLLSLHRCFNEIWIWDHYTVKEYFDNEAKQRIIKIVKEEPLDNFELSIHQARLKKSAIEWGNGAITGQIGKIAEREHKSTQQVKDSLINEQYLKSLSFLKPANFLNDFIVILAGWLDLKEVESIFQENLQKFMKSPYGNVQPMAYRLSLARFGDKTIQNELIERWKVDLNNDNLFKDYLYNKYLIPTQILYCGSQDCLFVLTLGLNSDIIFTEYSAALKSEYYPLNRLYLNFISQNIINFPYRYGEYSYYKKAEVSKEDIARAIKWMEENKGNYQFNDEKLIWPLE